MTSAYRIYVIDRFEGRTALLFADDAVDVKVSRRKLPKEVREGSVLRVPLDEKGVPDWRAAVEDNEERDRRLRMARDTLEHLQRMDPGGDVKL